MQVSIRCGVHSGLVQVGNMGFHSRLKYGVMGTWDFVYEDCSVVGFIYIHVPIHWYMCI